MSRIFRLSRPATATGKARSPTVDNRVRRTISDDDDAERRSVTISRLTACRMSHKINMRPRISKATDNNALPLASYPVEV